MTRGFILGGHALLTHPSGAVELIWTAGRGARWSEDAERAYGTLRNLATETAAALFFVGKRRVVLDGGVALAVGSDDPRPGWDLGSRASIDLLLAQEVRARSERPNIDGRSPDHGPGAADPR